MLTSTSVVGRAHISLLSSSGLGRVSLDRVWQGATSGSRTASSSPEPPCNNLFGAGISVEGGFIRFLARVWVGE